MSAALSVKLLRQAFDWFDQAIAQRLKQFLSGILRYHSLPPPVAQLTTHFENLHKDIYVRLQEFEGLSYTFENLREILSLEGMREVILKTVLLRFRRHFAMETETFLDRVHDPATRDMITADLVCLDRFLPPMLASGLRVLSIPSVLDFVSLRDAEPFLQRTELPPRVYDEKFHILQAPSLFLPDLQYYRSVCDLRQVPCTVAFIDIDHFKGFNTELGEFEVDRSVLPLLMRVLEGKLFGHGQAYRQGGDEYLAILPGLSRRLVDEFFDDLRSCLADLRYPHTQRQTTVSIGLFIAAANCPLTDREIQQKANQAKEHAKRLGRNCVVTFEDDLLGSTAVEREAEFEALPV
jgi:diguanylate cyclase (GGDEF)-like protein